MIVRMACYFDTIGQQDIIVYISTWNHASILVHYSAASQHNCSDMSGGSNEFEERVDWTG